VLQIRGAVAEYERTTSADRMRRGRLAALRADRRAGGGDSVRGAAERGRVDEGCIAIAPSNASIRTYPISNRISTAILTRS
jgi:DNA invertase Pin-like site-specific DNA recombinase